MNNKSLPSFNIHFSSQETFLYSFMLQVYLQWSAIVFFTQVIVIPKTPNSKVFYIFVNYSDWDVFHYVL